MDKLSDDSRFDANVTDYDVAFDGSETNGELNSNQNAERSGPADQSAGGEARVTVAQASTQQVPTPPPGEQVTIAVQPGVQYEFDFAQGDADFIFSDGNLVILVHGGGEIILQNFGAEAAGNNIPPLDFAGDTVGAFDLLTQTASAEQLADIHTRSACCRRSMCEGLSAK